MMVDSNGNPVPRKTDISQAKPKTIVENMEKAFCEEEDNIIKGGINLNFNSKVSVIRNTHKMRYDLSYNECLINEACDKFFEDVIRRKCGGSKYLGWNFNERGTLIRIEYEKYPDWSANESEVERATEHVSFEEIASYL